MRVMSLFERTSSFLRSGGSPGMPSGCWRLRTGGGPLRPLLGRNRRDTEKVEQGGAAMMA